jgi:hypothetical protein
VEYRDMSATLDVPVTPIQEVEGPPIRVRGGTFVFSHEESASARAAFALLQEGAEVAWAEAPFTLSGQRFPVGTYLVRAGGVPSGRVAEIAEAAGIEFVAGNPGVGKTTLRLPRIGLHKAWVANMDAGWISYLFDTYGIPFESVSNADIRAGQLHERFDVLVFADQSESQIVDGHAVGMVPPDYVGGLGDEGVTALRSFVQEGGHLVCNNQSCDLPIERFGLPVKNVLEGVPADSFNCPGALLKGTFESSHPMTFGMEDQGMIFFSRGRAYEIEGEGEEDPEVVPSEEATDVRIVASYPDEPLLLSGWMIGDEFLRGKAAAVDIPLGEGRVLAFGFNVHNRAQARSTAKLLFNALLYR